MGTMSIWHWLIVLIVILLIFGSGKISTLMGDLAKGIKVFKKNIAEDDVNPAQQAQPTPKPLGTSGLGNSKDESVSFNHNETVHSKTPSEHDKV